MKEEKKVIIIGSGIAGLSAALSIAEYTDVILITQHKLQNSNSLYAQGGVAAVFDLSDSIEDHIKDTLIAGDYLNKEEAVRVVVTEGPQHIRALAQRGVAFDLQGNDFDLAQEGGHRVRRIVHAKDATGKAIVNVLIDDVRANHRITVIENAHVRKLLRDEKTGSIVGVFMEHEQKGVTLLSPIVVLATGGSGQLYQHTTNPAGAVGSGVALAHAVGALIDDMEFIQFHPTALASNDSPHFLLSEALRGEGASLVNESGDRFMKQYHPLAELAPRDTVSRAIYQEQKNGAVYLDMTHLSKDFLQEKFPMIYKNLSERGFFLEKDRVPVTPAAHYQCGGVTTDLFGRTSVTGLYAIGEVARTGLHGANRLASNSLLECLVFAARCGAQIEKDFASRDFSFLRTISLDEIEKENIPYEENDSKIHAYIKQLMWEYVGIVRTTEKLAHAHSEIQKVMREHPDSFSIQSLCSVALSIIEAAQKREVSTGCHYRE